MRTGGISAEAARQRFSRLPGNVRVLYGIPFPKRARFIYLEEQFGSPAYWDALERDIDEGSPAYAAALAGVRARGGIIPRSHFDVVSGSPVLQKGQIASAKVLERLISVKLLEETEVEGVGTCIATDGASYRRAAGRAGMRARLITEGILIGAMQSWLGRMNMASPNVLQVRGEKMPRFSTFEFDICGPSYLRPIRRAGNGKLDPGFLVADIVLGRSLDEHEVRPFIRKVQTLSYLRGARPFMPMLIAEGFEPEALHACRAEGIITTRPDTLFGNDVGAALRDLLETLAHAAAVAANDPKRLEELFARLGSIEGAAGNLRGALFELIVGHMVRAIEGGSIDIGEIVRDMESNQSREIDVRLVKERKVTIYECKGYQPGSTVDRQEIDKWLKEKLPVIDKAHRQQERFDGTALRFEFWTTGTFEPEALVLLEDAKRKIRKYEVAWKDGSAVRDYAKQLKASGIRKILNEHYFSHPIARLSTAKKEDTGVRPWPTRRPLVQAAQNDPGDLDLEEISSS
jgi:hypothetical protein